MSEDSVLGAFVLGYLLIVIIFLCYLSANEQNIKADLRKLEIEKETYYNSKLHKRLILMGELKDESISKDCAAKVLKYMEGK